MSINEKWPAWQAEILRIMYEHDRAVELVKAEGGTEEHILQVRSQHNAALVDALSRHRREIDMLLGKPALPQQHYAEAVVTLAL